MKAPPVKASAIRLADLTDWNQCQAALEGIEMHAANCVGGTKAFFSGNRTYLTPSAQKKYDAIEAKAAKFNFDE